MRIRWISLITLLVLATAGCSPSPHVDTIQTGATSEPAGNANPPTNLPKDQLVASPTPEEAEDSSSAPLAVTVRPPVLFVAPIEGTSSGGAPTPIVSSHEGWQTFADQDFGISVDYPGDWSIDQEGESARFTSPQGKAILLQAAKNDEQSDQDCASLINSYGLTVDTCVNTATSTYSATFNLAAANRSAQWLTLSTANPEALDVYKAMLNSVRLTP